jgi:hypothetical protein
VEEQVRNSYRGRKWGEECCKTVLKSSRFPNMGGETCLLLGILEAVRDIVERLVLRDRVLGHARDGRVKRLGLRLVGKAVLRRAADGQCEKTAMAVYEQTSR